jgi:hypothetical protein
MCVCVGGWGCVGGGVCGWGVYVMLRVRLCVVRLCSAPSLLCPNVTLFAGAILSVTGTTVVASSVAMSGAGQLQMGSGTTIRGGSWLACGSVKAPGSGTVTLGTH